MDAEIEIKNSAVFHTFIPFAVSSLGIYMYEAVAACSLVQETRVRIKSVWFALFSLLQAVGAGEHG